MCFLDVWNYQKYIICYCESCLFYLHFRCHSVKKKQVNDLLCIDFNCLFTFIWLHYPLNHTSCLTSFNYNYNYTFFILLVDSMISFLSWMTVIGLLAILQPELAFWLCQNILFYSLWAMFILILMIIFVIINFITVVIAVIAVIAGTIFLLYYAITNDWITVRLQSSPV